jgi:hypothetical protein
MRLEQCRNELQNFLLEKKHRDCHVVVMPDFFLDRIINLPWNVKEFSSLVTGVANRKGGSLDGVSQTAPMNLSYVKTYGKASITTALEFQHRNQKTNVMLRDLGSLVEFGPSNLNQDDYALFETADYLCLFNWAGTLKFGTSLAEEVFGYANSRGCKTYFVTADPTLKRYQPCLTGS